MDEASARGAHFSLELISFSETESHYVTLTGLDLGYIDNAS